MFIPLWKPCVSKSCPINVGPSFDQFKIGNANPENHDHLVATYFLEVGDLVL